MPITGAEREPPVLDVSIGISAHAEESPDRLAVVLEPVRDGVLAQQRRTFRELDDRSRRLGGYLHDVGLRRGDTVAVLMENRAEFFETCWAAHRAGLFYVPIATSLTSGEAGFIIEDSGARLLVASHRLLDLAAEVAPPGSDNLLVDGVAGRFQNYEEVLARAPMLVEQSEGAALMYSSGTSGRPKGVETALPDLPWGAPDNLTLRMRQWYGIGPGDVYLSPGPLYHSAPLLYSLAAQRLGATVIQLDRFDAEGALAAIERWGVTHSQWVPSMFHRLLELAPEVRGRYDLSTHRVAIHAAAPCPVEMKRRMFDWWGPIIWEYYAASERVGATIISPEEWLAKPGSVGRPMVGTPHICDDEGNELPPGEVGTIWFGGGPTFQYRNDPDKTSGARDARGWQTVFDMGRLDDDGYLYLADRRSDLIITGGVNVYPREIELALIEHPAVGDAVVVGIPDDRFGQAVVALVEPHRGRRPEVDALRGHLSDRLAPFKRPRHIVVVDQLPRTESGKLRRQEIVNLVASLITEPNGGGPGS